MTDKKPKTESSVLRQPFPRALQLATILLVVAGFFFIRPYLGAILFSALISFIFLPVYKALLRKTKKPGLSVATTICVAIASLIIPFAILATVTLGQVNSLIQQYQTSGLTLDSTQIQSVIDTGTERIESILHAVPGGDTIRIDKTALTENIKNAVVSGLHLLAKHLANFGFAFFGFVGTFILAIFLVSAMLRYHEELITLLKKISPFDDSVNNLYLHKVKLMSSAMVKGQFLIAIAQGAASTLSLWIIGFDYLGFFFMLLTFLSFIPLGGGIITMPIGVVLIFTGHVWQGIFLILWHMLVVSFIDNIMRPYLVPKAARLNTALMLLAVFSGIAVFGFFGIVYGPVFMICLVTTIALYAEYNAKRQRIGLLADSELHPKPEPVNVKRKAKATT